MGWRIKRKATDSRTFVDLIHLRASKFPNWEPSYPIALGDYGDVDKETGEFVREANIFQDSKTKNTSNLTSHQGVEDDKYTIFSLDVSEPQSYNGVDISTPGSAGAAIKAQFKFGRRYGAMLLMCKPTTHKLEGFDDLIGPENDHLQRKCLVTEIVTCSAYAMYLSAKKSETITIELRASVPVAGAASLGAEVGGGWYHEGVAGVFRCGSQPDKTFTTLYKTKIITKRRIRRREFHIPNPETVGKDCWMDSVLPWNPLNADGTEEEDHNGVADYDSDASL